MTVADFNVMSRKLFPRAPYCLDHQLTLALGQPWQGRIDIVKLDDWMIRAHGHYRGSMRARVTELFGKAAAAFIQEAL